MPELVVRPSIKLIVAVYMLSGILMAAIAIYQFAVAPQPQENWYLWLIIPVFLDLWAASHHIRLVFTKLTLTGDKLRYESGMLSKSTRTIQVAKIQDVRVDQSIAQRILGLGDLSIETAGESSRLTMTNIDGPQRIAERLLDAAHHLDQRKSIP